MEGGGEDLFWIKGNIFLTLEKMRGFFRLLGELARDAWLAEKQ